MTASTAPQSASIKRVITSSALGTAAEFYDWALYGTTAALVLNKEFFPSFNPLVGTLSAFATFFVGYLARPVGGLIFGHYGDKLGRRTVMMITITLMGVGTTAVGLIPTYATIGIWAPVLLVIARVLQGIGLGGEYGGGILMALEHSPRGRKGLYCALTCEGSPLGHLLPIGLVTLLTTALPAGAYEAWAWRVPFLMNILLIGFGLWIRKNVSESPEFVRENAKKRQQCAASVPAKELLATHKLVAVLSLPVKMAESGLYVIYYTLAIAYATTVLDQDSGPILGALLIASGVEVITLPLFGALSDRIGRRTVYIGGAMVQMLWAVPAFLLISTGNFALLILAASVALGVGHAAMFSVEGPFFGNLYPVSVRYTGISFTNQVGAVLGGGLTPIIGTGLISAAGGHWRWLVVYAAALAIIASIAAFVLKRGEEQDTAAAPVDPVPVQARTEPSKVG